jgi:protein-disulfide isomerase
MWVFSIAVLIMAGVAFLVVSAGLHPQSKPIELPQANASNVAGGPTPIPKVGRPNLSTGYSSGNSSADIIFVEYSDFQCPYCSRVAPAVEKVRADYPQIRFAFRHFPLSAHPDAQKSAEAAECAGLQGRFWEMHNALFANQNDLAVSSLKRYAAALGLDAESFNRCLDTSQAQGAVNAQRLEGQGAGIRGTPGFLVFSTKGRHAALEQKLYAIADRFRGLGVSSAVVEVQGAGAGMVFAGAMPYSDYQSVLDAFN